MEYIILRIYSSIACVIKKKNFLKEKLTNKKCLKDKDRLYDTLSETFL